MTLVCFGSLSAVHIVCCVCCLRPLKRTWMCDTIIVYAWLVYV